MLPFLLIAGFLGQSLFRMQAARAQEEALTLQAKQATLQHAQKTLKNYSMLQDLISTQIAQETTKGVKMGSPSFNAIQRKTFNTAMENQRNLDIESDITEQNIKIEKKNVKATLYTQILGDAASTFTSLYGAGKVAPYSNSESGSNLIIDLFGNKKPAPITTLS